MSFILKHLTSYSFQISKQTMFVEFHCLLMTLHHEQIVLEVNFMVYVVTVSKGSPNLGFICGSLEL